MNDHERWFTEAVTCARKATCTRGRGGAVIVKDGKLLGKGYNAPPQDNISHSMCHLDQRESKKPKSDRTCCMHAEWRAILDALTQGNKLNGATLYYAGVNEENNLRFSGQPYCTVCSRLALDVGITYFGLYHEDGPKLYDTVTYNRLSYIYHDKI